MEFNKALAVFVVAIIIVGVAYGFVQYNYQKQDLSSAEVGFRNWRLLDDGGTKISMEYSVENTAERKIELKDFDLIVSFGDSEGTALVRGFALEPQQKIERTVQIPMQNVKAEDFLRFLDDGNVHVSGTAHLQFLFLETRTPFDYDATSRKMIF